MTQTLTDSRQGSSPESPSAKPKDTFDLMATLTLLDPTRLEISQTVGEGLILRSPGFGEKKNVSVKPCFAVTRRDTFLAFYDCDGKEIGILASMDGLSPTSRKALEQELAKQHFLPVITRIDAIRTEFHIPIWEVQTDCGPRTLELKSSHDAYRLHGNRVYVRDAEGNGYIIPDVRKLDRASRELLDLNV